LRPFGIFLIKADAVLDGIKSTPKAYAVRIWEGPPFAKNAKDGPPRIMVASKGAPPAFALW
jgi:hypothetical protein